MSIFKPKALSKKAIDTFVYFTVKHKSKPEKRKTYIPTSIYYRITHLLLWSHFPSNLIWPGKDKIKLLPSKKNKQTRVTLCEIERDRKLLGVGGSWCNVVQNQQDLKLTWWTWNYSKTKSTVNETFFTVHVDLVIHAMIQHRPELIKFPIFIYLFIYLCNSHFLWSLLNLVSTTWGFFFF